MICILLVFPFDMPFNEFTSFILDNLEASGAIGGYVSLSIIGFALISFATKKRYNKTSSQIGPKWAHPIIGSLLGVIPGCGATIVVASLYKNKKISFGGLFATSVLLFFLDPNFEFEYIDFYKI